MRGGACKILFLFPRSSGFSDAALTDPIAFLGARYCLGLTRIVEDVYQDLHFSWALMESWNIGSSMPLTLIELNNEPSPISKIAPVDISSSIGGQREMFQTF